MMGEGTADDWTARELRPLGSWIGWAAGVLLGALLGAAVTAAADRWSGRPTSPAEPVAVVREWPRRPIPVEWRWAPHPVKVDHMFRKRR